jgi:hypothetical protein
MRMLVRVTFQVRIGDGSSLANSIEQYQTFEPRPFSNPDGKTKTQYALLL